MASDAMDGSAYYPCPESEGGWRTLEGAGALREVAGMDLAKLRAARDWNAALGITSSVVVIRRGYLIAEWYEKGAGPDTAYNIYSCSKSFTGTAYGILFEDSLRSQQGSEAGATLDTPAYAHIPQGWPLTDPRKEQITLRHLLSMSSGIAGESAGIFGVRTDPATSPFAAAVGRALLKLRDSGAAFSVSELAAEPGARWDYSDPAFAHLSLAFRNITGRELADFLAERVFRPIGIEGLSWDAIGLDDAIGRHTCPFSGVHITARELTRFGYLMLRRGAWRREQLVAPWWVELAARPSQTLYPNYGLTWWNNYKAEWWPSVPESAFAAMGYNTNLCCIMPSLDLVAVRVGMGPTEPTEFVSAPFLAAVAQAVVER